MLTDPCFVELKCFEVLFQQGATEEFCRSIMTVPPPRASRTLNHPLSSTRIRKIPLGGVLFAFYSIHRCCYQNANLRSVAKACHLLRQVASHPWPTLRW